MHAGCCGSPRRSHLATTQGDSRPRSSHEGEPLAGPTGREMVLKSNRGAWGLVEEVSRRESDSASHAGRRPPRCGTSSSLRAIVLLSLARSHPWPGMGPGRDVSEGLPIAQLWRSRRGPCCCRCWPRDGLVRDGTVRMVPALPLFGLSRACRGSRSWGHRQRKAPWTSFASGSSAAASALGCTSSWKAEERTLQDHYCPGRLGGDEVERANYTYGDVRTMLGHYDPMSLRLGWNDLHGGERVCSIANPAMGFWACGGRLLRAEPREPKRQNDRDA